MPPAGGKQPSCCPPPKAPEPVTCGCGTDAGKPGRRPDGSVELYVGGWIETVAGPVPRVRHEISFVETLRRWAVRWGIGRHRHRVAPGLYAFGAPGPDSPVFVTCNFKLTFDRLRSDWRGLDGWLLVLDTKGINVWCAAGKGTFGTEELARRLGAARVGEVVTHRELIVPQYGAPGVAAHEVKKRTGFKVRYGPIRSEDVPRYLAAGRRADPEMREAVFPLGERLVLTPVELTGWIKKGFWALIGVVAVSAIGPGGLSADAAALRAPLLAAALAAGWIAGSFCVPVFLPWTPGRSFALKGALWGALGGALAAWRLGAGLTRVENLAALLAATAVGSFLGMYFTGSTPYTSPTGVEREMRRALPWQIGGAAAALMAWAAGPFLG